MLTNFQIGVPREQILFYIFDLLSRKKSLPSWMYHKFRIALYIDQFVYIEFPRRHVDKQLETKEFKEHCNFWLIVIEN